MTTRTSQSLLITLERLERSCPPVECLDVARVELERLVAVRHRVFVLWRFYAHVARRSIAVEDGLRLGRDGDGARVVLGGDGELSGLVRDIALLLQRRSERLAFLFRFRWNEWARDNKSERRQCPDGILTPVSSAWICSSVRTWSGTQNNIGEETTQRAGCACSGTDRRRTPRPLWVSSPPRWARPCP